MYKEYIINGKDLLVTDDEGNIKKFLNNDNSLKKIQLENDLEKLSEMRSKCTKSILINKNNGMNDLMEGIFVLLMFGGIGIATLIAIFKGVRKPSVLMDLFLLSVSSFGVFIGVTNIREYFSLKRDNKAISMELDYIEKAIEKVQRELLEVQKSINKDDVLENNIDKSKEGIVNKVEESSKMKVVNHDLELIWLYQNKKKEILKNYRDGLLVSYMNSLGYNLIDFYFIESIIEKDLGISEEKSKSFVKKQFDKKY